MLESMLQSGVHFGHQIGRWNSRMAPYIYQEKNGIHILDLVKTVQCLNHAKGVLKKSKNVVFVGTKPQIAETIKSAAESYGAHYVNKRWIGGLLTNWLTMSKCLKKLNQLEKLLSEDLSQKGYSKKEVVQLKKECDRLNKFFGGVKSLKRLPDLVVIVGQPNEQNAVRECQKLGIKTITLLDSNCDPDLTTVGIPANDDSERSVSLILEKLIS